MQSLTINYANSAPEKVISYWRLGEQLTAGRWYQIFRAAPRNISHNYGFGYVIKLVDPRCNEVAFEKAIDRLGREAIATEQIIHPNIIRTLDSELDGSPFFLVQPWMEGQSLDRYLATASEIALSRLLWAARQVMEGLRASHEHERAHLGLEPAHILLGKTGRVTLLGWSNSHRLGQPSWLPLDQLQVARHMAPECFQPNYLADPASDVYSLGTIIYQAISGRAPFSATTVEQIKQMQCQHVPADLMFVQPLCPPRLSQLVKEMMLKNPSQRPSLPEVLNRMIGLEMEHLTDTICIPL